jgi:hypothetical protein
LAKKINIKDLIAQYKTYAKNVLQFQVLFTFTAPTLGFEDIDKKMNVVDNPEPAINPNGTSDPDDDVTKESFILKRIGNIITEGAISGEVIDQETAYDTAIVEYAIAQMDILTKARPKFLSTFTKFM